MWSVDMGLNGVTPSTSTTHCFLKNCLTGDVDFSESEKLQKSVDEYDRLVPYNASKS